MALAVNDIIESKAYCWYSGQAGINVRHWAVTAVGGVSLEAADVANLQFTDLEALYTPLMPVAAEFRGVTVQKIFPLPPAVPGVSTAAPSPGDEVADALPRQVAGVVSLRTAFAGRRFRGRAYIPFIAETMNGADATPTPAGFLLLTAIATYYGSPHTYTVGADSVSVIPIIFHRTLPGTPTPVTGSIARDRWGTQRRRSDFGVPNAPFP